MHTSGAPSTEIALRSAGNSICFWALEQVPSVAGWCAARQAARAEKEKQEEKKLLLLPSSLLCLLNLVQKELTSKVCAEIHNVRSSGVFHCTASKRIGRNNIKVRGIFRLFRTCEEAGGVLVRLKPQQAPLLVPPSSPSLRRTSGSPGDRHFGS